MSAFLQSGRFYPGETPIFRVCFRPIADVVVLTADSEQNAYCPRSEDKQPDISEGFVIRAVWRDRADNAEHKPGSHKSDVGNHRQVIADQPRLYPGVCQVEESKPNKRAEKPTPVPIDKMVVPGG